MRLSEIRQILAERNIKLTKSLGQNFLHDGNQLRRIVEAAELTSTDKVLEIGPGLGPLTQLLLQRAGEVLSFEKDARLVEFMRERFSAAISPMTKPPTGDPSGEGNSSAKRGDPLPSIGGVGGVSASLGRLTLRHDDALDYLRRGTIDWSDWKLVANLPYSVASAILVELAQAKGAPRRIVATLQLEVARRLMANPGDDEYGVLTLLVQLRYKPQEWFKIPGSCFFPPPDVDSMCVTLIRRTEPLLNEEQTQRFTKIVKRAFSQRRKMMVKLLKEDWPKDKLLRAFEQMRLTP